MGSLLLPQKLSSVISLLILLTMAQPITNFFSSSTSRQPMVKMEVDYNTPARPYSTRPTRTYSIWNNKGGVGKTTMAFHLATQFAHRNPDKRVVVLDTCPQANVTGALLNCASKMSKLDSIKAEQVIYPYEDNDGSWKEAPYYRTISGYLMMRIQNKVSWSSSDFLVQVSKYNKNISPNLYLLCGDPSLELVIKWVEEHRNKTPMGSSVESAWKEGTLFLRHFIVKYGKENPERTMVTFIDTNPAFSPYTELAIAASDRLIIPVNADDFSKAAVNAMLGLVYGTNFDPVYNDEYFQAIQEKSFARRADREGIMKPKIHLCINNRVTQYNTRASKAYAAMGEQIGDILYTNWIRSQDVFTEPQWPGDSKEVMIKNYLLEMADFHKSAVHSIHTGTPLHGLHGKIILPDQKEDTVDLNNKAKFLKMLDDVVKRL